MDDKNQNIAYIEDSSFTLPRIKDGVIGLGDLWDCHRSKRSGENLFFQNFKERHLKAEPLKMLDYTLTHVKNTEDKLKTIKVEGLMSVELYSGLIKVEGYAEFDSKAVNNMSEERLIVQYLLDDWFVSLQPQAKEVMNNEVKNRLLEGKIKATHVVRAVTLGAEVNAFISVTQKETDKEQKIGGNVTGKVGYGPIGASIKSKLKWLDTDKASNCETRITIHSKPPITQQPSTIREMFEVVEGIQSQVSAQQHFKAISPKITGVPIRFELVPVSQYLNIPIERLYKHLQDNVQEQFRVMLVALQDFRVPGYLSSRVLESDSRLQVLLSDSRSSLSVDIAAYEKKLRKEADKFFERAYKILEDYKVARSNDSAIYAVVHEYSTSDYCVLNVYAKIEEFVFKGQSELSGVHETDANITKAERKLFSNSSTLNEWMSTETNIKMLLRTSGESSDGAFRRLFELSKSLHKSGIEIGIAFPSISKEFSLTIKVHGESVTHQASDIPHVLSIVGVAVGMGEPIETRFHAINASQFGLQLPLQPERLKELNELISTLSFNRGVYIARSSMDCIKRLSCLHTADDTRWKFFVSLDALDTASDAVMALRTLGSDIKFAENEWIVGTLGISQYHSAPLLCLFCGGELRAVCLDNFDLLILLQLANNKPQDAEEPDFSVLSPSRLSYSLYPDRAQFATKIIKLLPRTTANHQSSILNIEMSSFSRKPNQLLSDTLAFTRSALAGDTVDILSTVACSIVRQFPDTEQILKQHGWETSKFRKDKMSKANCKPLYDALRKWLNKQSPFLEKVEYAKSVIEHFKSLSETDNEAKMLVENAVSEVANDPLCPSDVRRIASDVRQITSDDYHFQQLCKAFLDILSTVLPFVDDGTFLNILVLIQLLRQIFQCEFDDDNMPVQLDIYGVLPKYINRLELYGKKDIEDYITNQQLYRIVSLLAKHAYDPQLCDLHRELDKLTGINVSDKEDHNSVTQFFYSLSSLERPLTEVQWSELWRNSRFLHLVFCAIKDQPALDAISSMVYKSVTKAGEPLPDYLPQDVRDILEKHHLWVKFEMPDQLKTIEDVIRLFKAIVDNGNEVPDFRRVFANSLENEELERSLEEAGVLFLWHKEEKRFDVWDMKGVISALSQLEQWKNRDAVPDSATQRSNVIFPLGINHTEGVDSFEVELETSSATLKIHKKWRSIMGETLPVMTPTSFVKLHSITNSPVIDITKMEECVKRALPFIIQRLKMWGGNVLCAEKVSTLIQGELKAKAGSTRSGPRFSKKSVIVVDATTTPKKQNIPFSRIDCISAIFCSACSTVSQDIVRIMSQFPMSLPLIMPDLEQESTYKVMLPALLGPTIKWESEPGVIVENHLFQSPFRMLVAVRLGTNSTGKSTILNQLMTTKNMFSSRSEPGAERGKPYSLHGSVEFTWLTQETCGTGLWLVLEKYYRPHEKAIILLANVHGDSIEHPDVIQFLNQCVSTYLVFVMPDCDEEKWKIFKQMVGSDKRIIHAMVYNEDMDPDPEEIVIDTRRLLEDETLAKVRLMFDQALNSDANLLPKSITKFERKFQEIKLGHSLSFAEGIEHLESKSVLEFVTKNTCYETRKMMKLQSQRSTGQSYRPQDDFLLWDNNQRLQELISLFLKVLTLPLAQRQQALAHLERDFSVLSAEESSPFRADVIRYREELGRTGLKNQNDTQKRRLRIQIAQAMERVDSINLGLENFFRELGQIYEIALATNPDHPVNAPVLKLPKRYAELLVAGNAIELLDGDSGDIPDAWFSAICDEVCTQFPNLRVFVVTILGLQSSGKSTLLNALFACRFAVSVGRCTRGLFMRLLFLNAELCKELQVDAILLVDTEGLGAPEKANDVYAERKDRLLATFAMGVSNLTIINVLGEYMRDLTDILQIAIVAMARLEQAGMSPDLLMVQHLTERNKAKSSQGSEQFRLALEKALDLATQKDDEIGIAGANCLQNLILKLQPGQKNLLHQFRPFKDGASAHAPPSMQYHEDVVQLYESIIDSCRQSRNKMEFSKWRTLVRSYWSSVSQEQFAVSFKNVNEIIEFIRRGELIAKVKEAIEAAFSAHSAAEQIRVRIIVQKWLDTQAMGDPQRHQNFLARISDNLTKVPRNCSRSTSESSTESSSCQECQQANQAWERLHVHVKDQDYEPSTMRTIYDYIGHVRQSTMKMLSQMVDALSMKQNYSMMFMKEVNQRLEEELKNKSSDKVFTAEERAKIVDQIWNKLLQIAASQEKLVPVKRLIHNEVEEGYMQAPPVFWDHYSDKAIFSFRQKQTSAFQAFTVFGVSAQRQSLKQAELDWLESNLDRLVLQKNRETVYKDGMIRGLHKRITEKVEEFEKLFNGKLKPEYKWKLHSYCVKKFIVEMEAAQLKWDQTNNPRFILKSMEADVRSQIDTRLQYGFTSASEGYIIGKRLLEAINQQAQKMGDHTRVNSVLGLSWILNSQNVRLEYLSHLAREVRANEFERATTFFTNPEHKIKEWFQNAVDGHICTDAEDEFHKTFDRQFDQVCQKISDGASIQEIQDYVEFYLANAEGIEYKSQNLDDVTAASLDIFRQSILKQLNNQNLKMEFCKIPKFENPSNSEMVMRRLGCTEACAWCGALCWGERGHDKNTDLTRKHHTCHQPRGLATTHEVDTGKLRAQSCDQTSDETFVIWDENRMPWRQAKEHPEFENWKFGSHNMNQFNSLMRWFFFKLNESIATSRGLQPATASELEKHNCVDINLTSVLATIQQHVR